MRHTTRRALTAIAALAVVAGMVTMALWLGTQPDIWQ